MPSLPRPPRRGQSLADANLPEIIARLIDYVRSITPRSSPTVRVSITSSGTTLSVPKSPPRSGSGAGSTSPYASYFRVKDASYGGNCLIGVDNGQATGSYCGGVYINGSYAPTLNYTDLSSRAEAGTVYVWLVSYITTTGAYSVIYTTDSDAPPTVTSLAQSTQLLGRVQISYNEDDSTYYISNINQDHLRGGEHHVVLIAPCAIS